MGSWGFVPLRGQPLWPQLVGCFRLAKEQEAKRPIRFPTPSQRERESEIRGWQWEGKEGTDVRDDSELELTGHSDWLHVGNTGREELQMTQGFPIWRTGRMETVHTRERRWRRMPCVTVCVPGSGMWKRMQNSVVWLRPSNLSAFMYKVLCWSLERVQWQMRSHFVGSKTLNAFWS